MHFWFQMTRQNLNAHCFNNSRLFCNGFWQFIKIEFDCSFSKKTPVTFWRKNKKVVIMPVTDESFFPSLVKKHTIIQSQKVIFFFLPNINFKYFLNTKITNSFLMIKYIERFTETGTTVDQHSIWDWTKDPFYLSSFRSFFSFVGTHFKSVTLVMQKQRQRKI